MRQFMRNRARIIGVLSLVIIFTMSIGNRIYAHEVPDFTRKGKVSITMKCGTEIVSGGTVTLYRVGSIIEDNGNFDFDTGEKTAKELMSHVKEQDIVGQTKTIGLDGNVVFEELDPALYLVAQDKAASGYLSAEPFLVSVPMQENGIYIYEVDASPKVEIEKESSSGSAPNLPQTGQLNWPIPVFAAMGLILFAIGFIMRYGK